MTGRPTIQCPRCGASMNCHAAKPSEPQSEAEAADAMHELGVVIDEVHTCPACGAIEARRVVLGRAPRP